MEIHAYVTLISMDNFFTHGKMLIYYDENKVVQKIEAKMVTGDFLFGYRRGDKILIFCYLVQPEPSEEDDDYYYPGENNYEFNLDTKPDYLDVVLKKLVIEKLGKKIIRLTGDEKTIYAKNNGEMIKLYKFLSFGMDLFTNERRFGISIKFRNGSQFRIVNVAELSPFGFAKAQKDIKEYEETFRGEVIDAK